MFWVKARSDLRDSRCVIRMRISHASQGLSLSWLALRKTQLIGIFLILRFTHRKYLPWFAMRITRCDSRTSVRALCRKFVQEHRHQYWSNDHFMLSTSVTTQRHLLRTSVRCDAHFDAIRIFEATIRASSNVTKLSKNAF